MKNYLAITIGPIYQTFRNARQTREVWAASFLFSYLAKGIITRLCLHTYSGSGYSNLTEADINAIISKADQFVLPNISDERLFEAKSGVGLFPDRIIVKLEEQSKTDFQSIIDLVVKDIATEIATANHGAVDDTFKFLKQYLRIDWDIYGIAENANPIIEISQYLDSLELTPNFVSKVSENPLDDFLLNINKNGFLANNYNELDTNNNIRFESLVEIATRELRSKPYYRRELNSNIWDEPQNSEQDKGDTKFIDALSRKTEDFKNYHKYICIVKADGDKIGKTLQKINGNQVFDFSKKLLNWGLDVKDKIRTYGGVPIYVGGDDLLFFAPVCSERGNIIDLIDLIDEAFVAQQWSDISTEVMPSLSYGVSLTYYKFPLGEAIEEASNLMYAAKKAGGNAIALKLLKHSGSEFELTLKKDDRLYHNHFKELLAKMVHDKSFLNSVGYKLRDNHELIKIIGGQPTRLASLFNNVFDERLENRQATDLYLQEVRELLNYSYLQQNNDIEKTMKEVFSIIRTSKFIKGLEEVKN